MVLRLRPASDSGVGPCGWGRLVQASRPTCHEGGLEQDACGRCRRLTLLSDSWACSILSMSLRSMLAPWPLQPARATAVLFATFPCSDLNCESRLTPKPRTSGDESCGWVGGCVCVRMFCDVRVAS